MKLAFFHNLNFGGAKRVVFEQIKYLSQYHEIDLYKLDNDDDIFDPIDYAKEMYRIPFSLPLKKNTFSRLASDYQTFFSLKNFHKSLASQIDERQYDLVVVHPDKFTQAPYLLSYLKTPSVYYCQEPLRIAYEYSMRLTEQVSPLKRGYETMNRMIRKKIDRENVRASSYTLASCYHVRERMIESYDVYPDINYPGIDTDLFTSFRRKKKNQVVFVGGKDVVTDGYSLLEKGIQLLPSNVRPKIKVITFKKKNNQRLSDRELVTIYNESQAVFCVSTLETFGLVPLEAMACGIPVIATNVSGHRETVIHNKTGFLIEFHPEQIALSYQKILEKDTARKLGEQGISHIKKHWTWEKRGQELHHLLMSYVNRP